MKKPTERLHPPDRDSVYRDSSLLEKSVLLVVIMLVVTILLQSYTYFREQIEKSSMEQLVTNIQAALNIHMANALLTGRPQEVVEMARGNPIRLLRETPANYLGEFHDVGTAALPAGNWYFDTRRKFLVYLVEYDEHFENPGPKTVHYQLVLDYGNGHVIHAAEIDRSNAPLYAAQAITIKPTAPIRWLVPKEDD